MSVLDQTRSEVPNLNLRLTVLRAVDRAHSNRQISSGMRYHILQSLFPAVEPLLSNAEHFLTASAKFDAPTKPQPILHRVFASSSSIPTRIGDKRSVTVPHVS